MGKPSYFLVEMHLTLKRRKFICHWRHCLTGLSQLAKHLTLVLFCMMLFKSRKKIHSEKLAIVFGLLNTSPAVLVEIVTHPPSLYK